MSVKKQFEEPQIRLVDIAGSAVALYTSTAGNDGDVWEKFDDGWLSSSDN